MHIFNLGSLQVLSQELPHGAGSEFGPQSIIVSALESVNKTVDDEKKKK